MLYYDPTNWETQIDPYPIYARLREEAPVYHNEKLGFWALSRFEDVWDAHSTGRPSAPPTARPSRTSRRCRSRS